MNINQIESAILGLQGAELAGFAQWFDGYMADKIDSSLEKAISNGQFDALAQQALKDFENGKCTDL